jgi:hypothetical protein
MIDPEVKWISHSDEPPTNDGSPFMLAMSAGVGPRDEEGVDEFQFIVCNAAWLQARATMEPAVWPRGHLIIERFDTDHVKAVIQELANTFRRSADWAAFAERLNRYLLWEFEDIDDFQGDVNVPWPGR